MKLRPFFILLLFVVSTGILAWIYHTATRHKSPPQSTPWIETLSDLNACGRRKHVQSVLYDHFADIAGSEQQRNAAHLFRAIALAERLQENNCATAIVRLGGSYTPPTKVLIFRGTTDNNLERSITYERRALDADRRADIDRAIAQNNRYAARMLIWASAGDMRHLRLLEHYRREAATANAQTIGYLVCPLCGNIYATDTPDAYCPTCMTDSRKFVRFE